MHEVISYDNEFAIESAYNEIKIVKAISRDFEVIKSKTDDLVKLIEDDRLEELMSAIPSLLNLEHAPTETK